MTARRCTIHDPAIGARIRRARAQTGLSQRAVVKNTPYTGAYLSRIEAGERTPSVRAIRAFAEALGVSATFLETGIDSVDVRLPRAVAEGLLAGAVGPTDELHASLIGALEQALGLEVVGLA